MLQVRPIYAEYSCTLALSRQELEVSRERINGGKEIDPETVNSLRSSRSVKVPSHRAETPACFGRGQAHQSGLRR